jgi:uncharacterized protein
MNFPISGHEINPIYLVLLGFSIGVLGGFFGVGGSFLAGPGLFITGLPMNFVVGTDLAHIVGKSIVATRQHLVRGNVDVKLGAVMAGGTITGTELGAQAIEKLKDIHMVDIVVGVVFIAVLISISAFIAWEAWRTIKDNRVIPAVGAAGSNPTKRQRYASPAGGLAEKIRRINLPPMIKFEVAGLESVSLWVVLAVGLSAGLFAGFLGGGAGYVRMPSLIYLLGVPTVVAVGTDLFEVVISAGYGTISHGLKGNVDIMIALLMHTGAAIGAQIGVRLTSYFTGPRIRLAFSPLPLLGAALIVYGLLTGQELQ